MIFKDKLKEKGLIISSEIDKLLDIAWNKQAHIGDLLLFHINGFYQEDTLIWNENNPEKKFNPHVIGLGSEGHSEQAHYSFIHKYRTTNISSPWSVPQQTQKTKFTTSLLETVKAIYI